MTLLLSAFSLVLCAATSCYLFVDLRRLEHELKAARGAERGHDTQACTCGAPSDGRNYFQQPKCFACFFEEDAR